MTDYFQIARRGGEDSVILLQALPNINVVSEDGRSLLHMAVGYRNHVMTDALLKLGVNVNGSDSRGQTPLHYAAELQDTLLTKTLLERGANVEAPDNFGNTPVWSATFGTRENSDVLQLLLQRASPAAVLHKNNAGVSPLELAKRMGIAGLVELLTNHAARGV